MNANNGGSVGLELTTGCQVSAAIVGTINLTEIYNYMIR